MLPAAVSLNPRQLNTLNSMNRVSNRAYAAWFTDRAYASTDQVTVELQAQGNRDHTVRIINIAPVEKCAAPLIGTLFYNPAQGENLSAQLYLDLNDPTTPASYTTPDSPEQKPGYFSRYSISLRPGEQNTFQVTASIKNRSCQFTLNATVIDDGRTTVESISDHGHPFRITSLGAFASYKDLYLGGPTSEGITGGKTNRYQNALWVRADPKTYK